MQNPPPTRVVEEESEMAYEDESKAANDGEDGEVMGLWSRAAEEKVAQDAFELEIARAKKFLTSTKVGKTQLADAVGRLSEAVVLLTDLYPGNSGTFHREAAHESALRILQDRLPLGPTNAQAEQWRAVNDSGLRGMLELEVCARARLLVTCNEALVNESLAAGNQPRRAKCAKLSSGFTERVVALNKARGEGNRTAW